MSVSPLPPHDGTQAGESDDKRSEDPDSSAVIYRRRVTPGLSQFRASGLRRIRGPARSAQKKAPISLIRLIQTVPTSSVLKRFFIAECKRDREFPPK